MSDLKPCPFCGDIPKLTIWNPSDGQHRDYASGVWIASIKSDFVEIEKSSWESEEDARNKAIKAWNQRPSQWQDISTAPRDEPEKSQSSSFERVMSSIPNPEIAPDGDDHIVTADTVADRIASTR